MRVVFVHGACVRDGSWWWHPTAELLAPRGIESIAPLLPTCGETGLAPGAGSFNDDVASVRHVLSSSEEPTILMAHSYGGMVAAEAAAGVTTVRHLVLVSSYLPEVGESLSSFLGDGPGPFIDIDPDALTMTVRPDMLVETFLHDCSDEIGAEAQRHLAEQSLAVTQHQVQAAAWQEVPSTYVVCTEDRGTPAASQRVFAARANMSVELDTGHHPFLSHPRKMADLVLDLAHGLDRKV